MVLLKWNKCMIKSYTKGLHVLHLILRNIVSNTRACSIVTHISFIRFSLLLSSQQWYNDPLVLPYFLSCLLNCCSGAHIVHMEPLYSLSNCEEERTKNAYGMLYRSKWNILTHQKYSTFWCCIRCFLTIYI
jgi:hypothetical protein